MPTSSSPKSPREHSPPRRRLPRKRGAQPGNLNALKHGYYARSFPQSDLADLDSLEFSGLLDEIKLLRVGACPAHLRESATSLPRV